MKLFLPHPRSYDIFAWGLAPLWENTRPLRGGDWFAEPGTYALLTSAARNWWNAIVREQRTCLRPVLSRPRPRKRTAR